MKTMRLILACGCAVFCALSLFGSSNVQPDLLGRITDEDGSPVPKATVFVYTAGPKQGTASVCPSCYPDCRKKAQTDRAGRFKIESLDPKLLFRLLVVASGHESTFVTKVDAGGGAREVTLKRLSPDTFKSSTRIAGMVMDEKGAPVIGAVISPEGVQYGSGTRWGATDEYVDPVAVADDKGRFILLCKKETQTVHATVEGNNVAKRWVALTPGKDHLVRMQEGVTITGRIVRDGKPLREVAMGLVTKDRACGNNLRCDELATDKEGRFLLANVPPEREFVLYATMDSLRGQGAVESRIFTTGKTGTTLDLGKLEAKPAHRLAGRVVLSDGTPVPPDTRLFLGREDAWDHTEATLGTDGRFEFQGVPPESVGLSVRIKGYKFSKRNPSLDWLNGGIVGRVTGDQSDLTLLMEPGEWRYNREEEDAPAGVDRQPQGQPLRGAKL
jgi:hypothetical protein